MRTLNRLFTVGRTLEKPLMLCLFLWLGNSFLYAQDTWPVLGTPVFDVKVVNKFPHQSSSFTQGLLVEGNVLYESTGLRGSSSLLKVDLKSGSILKSTPQAEDVFSEGLAVLENTLYQLTWTSGRVFLYDKESFTLKDTLSYEKEGWGLTSDGVDLIMSHGDSEITFRDALSFEVKRKITVRDEDVPITLINELEYIEGKIYANIWLNDWVAVISPDSGKVESWIDLKGLKHSSSELSSEDVANGIAWDKNSNRLFVTGKRWDSLYEITLEKRKTPPQSGGCFLKNLSKKSSWKSLSFPLGI